MAQAIRPNEATTASPDSALWRSAHSRRRTYQALRAVIRLSNHTSGLCSQFWGSRRVTAPKREASQGVSVKQTSSDMSVLTTMVTAYCRSTSPMVLWMKAMGRNTTTSTMVMAMAEKPISERPSRAACTLSLPISRCR